MATNVLSFIRDKLSDALKDIAPVRPVNIQVLGALPDDLKNLDVSTDDWSKLGVLLDKLKALDEIELAESLVFRILELHLPRVAGLLLLFGAVKPEFTGDTLAKHAIDWDNLFKFVSDPVQLLDYWTDKIQHASDVQLLQIYLPTLAYAPNSFLQFDHRNLGFSALSATRPLRPELQALITALVNSPTPLPIPGPGDLPITLNFDGTPPVAAGTFLEMVNRVKSGAANELWNIVGGADADLVGRDLEQISVTAHINRPARMTFDIGDRWTLTIRSPVSEGKGIELQWSAGKWSAKTDQADLFADLITFEVANSNATPLMLGGPELLLEVDQPRMFATIRVPAEGTKRLFSVGASIDRVSLTIKPPGLKLLGGIDEFKASTQLGVEYVLGEGMRAQSGGSQGAVGINFTIPINRSIGQSSAGLTIGTLETRLEFALDNTIAAGSATGLQASVAMTFDAKAKLGPVELIASGMGAKFGRYRDRPNAPLRYAEGITPTGVGASLNAGPISGGGFLQMQQSGKTTRIGGALALKLTTIGIGALGLLEDGPDGTSFVFILGIRFTPGIQLSFGFELTGVGGLVGLNRRSDNDVLRERLTSGAAGNVLFCSDPVREGPALLGYLGEMFPPSRGGFLIGPTLQVSWIAPIVRLNLGVLIELPGPGTIVILGSLQALIGTEDVALVNLRLDFMGVIDLVKQEITFDASLVNSSILGVLKITGDAAFRLSFGSAPDVVLSIGGFHPRFNAESLHLRPLARVSSSLSLDASVVNIWLRQEAYFAFTSNTLQLGGRTEAGLEIGPLGAHGFLSLDALVQFKPFYFDVAFSAGFDITVFGEDFCGVDVSGRITGPGPLVITASASVKILFVRISHAETFRLGPNHPDEPVRIGNLGQLFLDEAIKNPANLKTGDNDPQVHPVADSQAGSIDADLKKRRTVLCPVGTLTWTQTLAPLELTITRLRGQLLDAPKSISVIPQNIVANSSPVNEWFSSGHFMEQDESQKLSHGGMFSNKSGMSFGLKLESSPQPAVGANPNEVQVIRLPKRLPLKATQFLRLSLMDIHTLTQRLRTPQIVGAPAGVTLIPERWKTVHSKTGAAIGGLSERESFQRTRPSPLGSREGRDAMFCVAENTKAVDLTAV